ncbi:M20 family metallo-hydrolase [Kocuria sp. M1R5S2]|uniref:M20 family metallo-hydrolase n=1 Tax=Kocuria rhizosphaerae TaxID=3376285 RepID=UPI00378E861B
MTNSLDTMGVDRDRLWSTIEELGRVGAYEDENAGTTGVRRLALTDEDMAGRRLVLGWFEAAGLSVRHDRMGNVYARRAGLDDGLAPVRVGSHLDTVNTGGRFDGALGVLGGLEIVRCLDDAGIQTQRPVEVVVFTDEEGVRFETVTLGSAVASGRIPLERARKLADPQGVTVGSELDRHGLSDGDPVPGPEPYAYLECHIEQGPVLAREDVQVGVVTGIFAITWKEIVFTGVSAHAGTTPYELRHNAGLAAALVTVALHEMVSSGRYGDMRATAGRVEQYPNATNVVPGSALMTVDMRCSDAAHMAAAQEALDAAVRRAAEEAKVEASVRITAQSPPVEFDPEVCTALAKSASNLGISSREMVSGAAHDAGEMAALGPAGMVFVPGLQDGISHNPQEYSTPEACADGITVMLRAVCELAGVPALQ